MERKDKALDVLAAVSGKERASIAPDMELVADLGVDSPKALRLLADLEDALDVEISDEDAARMESVGDVLSYVEGLG